MAKRMITLADLYLHDLITKGTYNKIHRDLDPLYLIKCTSQTSYQRLNAKETVNDDIDKYNIPASNQVFNAKDIVNNMTLKSIGNIYKENNISMTPTIKLIVEAYTNVVYKK